MALITPTEINSIAFITPIPEEQFKTTNIDLVENRVAAMLGTLYASVIASPADYSVLLDTYIKPYMAYSIKSLTLNTIISDGGLSSEQVASYLNAINSAGTSSQYYYNQLVSFLNSVYGITRKIMSGFIVS